MKFTRRELLRVGGAGAVVGTAGCTGLLGGDGGDGGDGGTDTTTSRPPSTDRTTQRPTTTTNPACEEVVEVGGRLTEDTTWDCPQYRLASDVSVADGATLTVAAGVEVVAAQATRLVASGSGTLLVEGTDSDPVVFRGEQDVTGFWDGIEIGTGNTTSRLTYAQVANGGNGNWANVYVQSGASPTVEDCSFTDCSTYGVIVERGAEVSGFARNAFSGNERGAMQVPTAALGNLDDASTYAGGAGPDRIEVVNEAVESAATWPATDAPYYFTSDAPVRAPVTVAPGAALTFAQSARLAVTSGGSLSAVGTASDRISFAGEQAVPGFWDGIEFNTNSADNRLAYADVAHGGNGNWANVYVQSGSSASLENSTFADCSTYGVIVERGGSLGTFAANAFSGNERGAMQVATAALGSLDDASTYVGGAGPDRIEVTNEAVATAATWPATDAPYYFASDAPVRAPVTIAPGATLTFAQSARLSVTNSGSLTAVSDGQPITFAGEQAVQGFWDGIEFGTLNPDNVLDGCVVTDGGNGGWANVYVQSTGMATVENCRLENSATYGIVAERNARLTQSGNTFANNVEGDVDAS